MPSWILVAVLTNKMDSIIPHSVTKGKARAIEEWALSVRIISSKPSEMGLPRYPTTHRGRLSPSLTIDSMPNSELLWYKTNVGVWKRSAKEMVLRNMTTCRDPTNSVPTLLTRSPSKCELECRTHRCAQYMLTDDQGLVEVAFNWSIPVANSGDVL
ncbi:hypothetical protein EV401DRAFT_1960878 [Pisolithus croceorrhizus]|nr:hypothetical protein EV401DRAFT_1960878 [Pisolithus croceorrhizus]